MPKGHSSLLFSMHNLSVALLMGFIGLIAQLSLTNSFQHLDPSVASALGRTAILWGALLDAILYSNTPTLLAWISYGTVLLGVFCALVLGTKRQKSYEAIISNH